MKVKVGQEIKFKDSFDIETFGGRKISVKECDKGIVTSSGFIRHTNGNTRGMMQKLDDIEVEGCAYKNISEMILNRLNGGFRFEEFLSYKEIDKK